MRCGVLLAQGSAGGARQGTGVTRVFAGCCVISQVSHSIVWYATYAHYGANGRLRLARSS
jgi:hypothetical protein